ncbi:12674_t:CDS:2 [Entrophospora sp. SA101]|nr:12674_t:CDS:2 [Entrophospora sp. SA101]
MEQRCNHLIFKSSPIIIADDEYLGSKVDRFITALIETIDDYRCELNPSLKKSNEKLKEFEISGYGIINNYLSSIIGLLLGGDENNDNEDNKNSNNKSIDEILMVRSDDLTPVEEKYIQLNVYLNYDYDKIFENIKKFSLD